MFGGPNPFQNIGQQIQTPLFNLNTDSSIRNEEPQIIQPPPGLQFNLGLNIPLTTTTTETTQTQIVQKTLVNKDFSHPGEKIPSRCYLSIDSQSTKAKVFPQSNMIIFMQGENDLQILINQEDYIQNILSPFHREGMLAGNIIDFTLINNTKLYLLYQLQLLILDISPLLAKSQYQQKPIIVEQISLKDLGLFYRVESAMEDQYIVLLHKSKAQILQMKANGYDVFVYKIDNDEQRIIRDIEIHKSFICVLYDKNEITVYDIISKQRVFRSIFRDASSQDHQITRLFFVDDFEDDIHIDEDINKFKDDEVIDDEFENNQKQFQGHFLLVENKIIKPQRSNQGSAKKESKSQSYFEKICLVKVINGSSLQSKKGPLTQDVQSFFQNDFLKISERTSKIVEYDKKRGIVFLLNKEKPNQSLRLYSVKLKQGDQNDSDSDDEHHKNNKHRQFGDKSSDIKFGFIKEMRLNLNYSVTQAINTGSSSKKPKFLKLIRKSISNEIPETFYLYISIGGKILVHSFGYTDLIENQDKIKNYADSHMKSANISSSFGGSLFNDDILSQLRQGHQPLSESRITEQEDQPFGIIPTTDKKERQQKQKAQKQSNNQQPLTEQQAYETFLEQIIKMSDPNQNQEEFKEEQHLENQDDLLQRERDLVQKEMQQAIEEEIKEIENPIMIISEELKNDVELISPSQQQQKPEGQKLKGMVKQEQIIQQIQQQQNAAAAGTGKKKKKKKDKSAANVMLESQGKYSNEKPILKTQIQSQHIIVSQLPSLIQQQKTQQQQSQLNFNNNNKKSKTQQEQLIDNYNELTKKYQEMAQKLSKMQDHLLNQQNQQAELDRCIQKNIKACLPAILEQQMKEVVVPIVVSHMKGLDKQIKEDLMPQVQTQVEAMFSKISQNKQISVPNQQKQQPIVMAQGEQVSDQVIKEIIMQEFSKAMEYSIKPMLQEQFKSLIDDVQTSLQYVNQELSQKLRLEEDKNQNLINFYMEKIQELIEQQNLAQNVAHPPLYPGMAPPPYMHPGYIPPPYQQIQPFSAYSPFIPQTKDSQGKNASMKQIDLQKKHSYQQQFNPLFQQMNPLSLNKSNIERRYSNKIIDSSDDEGNGNHNIPQNLDPEYIGEDEDDQTQYSKLGQPQKKKLLGQQVLMFNDEEIMSESRRQSEKAQFITQQNLQKLMKSKSNSLQQTNNIQPQVLGLGQTQSSGQAKKDQKNSVYNHLIQYMKAVANGKPRELDFLFNTPKFFSEMQQFLTHNSHHLNTQHSNIIYQFMKKVVDKVKENPQVLNQANTIFSLLYFNVCQVREDMKQRVEQVDQLARELKSLSE